MSNKDHICVFSHAFSPSPFVQLNLSTPEEETNSTKKNLEPIKFQERKTEKRMEISGVKYKVHTTSYGWQE